MSTIARHHSYETTVASESGNDDAVDFGPDALGDSSYWIPVGQYRYASLYVDVGAAGSSLTVNGKATLNSPSETISAQAAQAADGRKLDAQDIKGYEYIQVKSQGTATQTTVFYLLLKSE